MEDPLSVDGKTLALQGVGVRKKFILSVYVGGLYLTTPTRDGTAAIAADEPKRLSLVFLREVDGPRGGPPRPSGRVSRPTTPKIPSTP